MHKIKSFIESNKGKDILTVVIVILVGLGSFSLGRLSKNAQNEGLQIEYSAQGANVIQAINEAENGLKQTKRVFFASTRGKKYYSLTCSAGKTIKQENRIYFDTREEAENAGYELSSSCR